MSNPKSRFPVKVQIRLSPTQARNLKRLGNAQWVRQALDAVAYHDDPTGNSWRWPGPSIMYSVYDHPLTNGTGPVEVSIHSRFEGLCFYLGTTIDKPATKDNLVHQTKDNLLYQREFCIQAIRQLLDTLEYHHKLMNTIETNNATQPEEQSK
jgi:hypothetical protein